jgi:hypothetical protein
MTYSIITLTIVKLSITTLIIMTLSIMVFSTMTISIMALSIIALDMKCCYAECYFMLSLSNEPFILSVIMLNVIMVIDVAPLTIKLQKSFIELVLSVTED